MNSKTKRLILILIIVGNSFGNPLYQQLVYKNGCNFGMENGEHMTQWEREHEGDTYVENGLELTSSSDNGTLYNPASNHNVESWSLALYLICFFLLIFFFLLISIMEVCCKRAVLSAATSENQNPNRNSPPPYDLFGPPNYDSLNDPNEKKEADESKKNGIFVINVIKPESGSDDEPKETHSIDMRGSNNPCPAN